MEKGLFPPFSGFSRGSSGLPEMGEKGRKRAKKADFGRFPGREARHPLNPHLLHPHLRHSNSSKIRGKFGEKIGAKFGTTIRKIRETFVLQLLWILQICLGCLSRVAGLPIVFPAKILRLNFLGSQHPSPNVK